MLWCWPPGSLWAVAVAAIASRDGTHAVVYCRNLHPGADGAARSPGMNDGRVIAQTGDRAAPGHGAICWQAGSSCQLNTNPASKGRARAGRGGMRRVQRLICAGIRVGDDALLSSSTSDVAIWISRCRRRTGRSSPIAWIAAGRTLCELEGWIVRARPGIRVRAPRTGTRPWLVPLPAAHRRQVPEATTGNDDRAKFFAFSLHCAINVWHGT